MVWRPVNHTSNNVLSLGLNNFNKQSFCDVWQRKMKIASKFKIQIARNIQTNSGIRKVAMVEDGAAMILKTFLEMAAWSPRCIVCRIFYIQ